MNTQTVLLTSIDFEDKTFLISEDVDPPRMLQSLRKIGQLNPVLLLDSGQTNKTIVSGFRRLRALRRIGAPSAIACLLPKSNYSLLKAFHLALWDNLSHRQFGPLEVARILSKLKHSCGVSSDTLINTYLPMLGLARHQNVLHAYLSLDTIDLGLRHCFGEARLTLASVERLAEMESAAQSAFASMMERIRLSASLQREVLDLVTDLAALAETDIAGVLSGPEIVEAQNDARLPPGQRGQKVYEILYRQKNPRLSQATKQFEEGKKRLGLPGTIRLTPDPYFETPRLRIEFDALSAGSFREMAATLQKASADPILDSLFDVK